MACVAAPIIGGPRPPPAQRRTHPTPPKNPIGPAYHTLKCEEPGEVRLGPIEWGVVTVHNPWGLGVRLEESGDEGVMVLTSIHDDPRHYDSEYWPDTGERVRIRPIGFWPDGNLRLSGRPSFVDRPSDPPDWVFPHATEDA